MAFSPAQMAKLAILRKQMGTVSHSPISPVIKPIKESQPVNPSVKPLGPINNYLKPIAPTTSSTFRLIKSKLK